MKRVLCISPHFPPMNAPDMHRLRQVLPYIREHGWDPVVVAVDPERCEGARDPLLLQTVPPDIEVIRVGALSARHTRVLGLGNLGIRSWLHLRRAVNQYLAKNKVDLVFFTTTVFTSIAHGPAWKRRFGVPFVVDLQDPWRNDYYLAVPATQRPAKFWFDYRQKRLLEAHTMPEAAGVLAVSESYLKTMQERYPALVGRPTLTLPFGAVPQDFEIARALPAKPGGETSRITMLYIGRGGRDMAVALTILFRAVRSGLERRPELFSRLHMEFLGTSYAPAGQGIGTVRPVAEREGVAALVSENPDRVSYFRTLRGLMDADLLVVPGSDDPGYTASKIYPYILAERPLLAIFHEASSVVTVLEKTRAGELVTFGRAGASEAAVISAEEALTRLLTRPSARASTDWAEFEPFTARATTARLTQFFDAVADASRPGEKVRRRETGDRTSPRMGDRPMKRVLCISPNFPPVNTPDMHRLRQMIPRLGDHGWEPVIMAVDPSMCEAPSDPLLLRTLPPHIEVIRVGALNPRLTRLIGLGNLGIRSWLQLRRAGNRYLAQNHVDLIFFSTTVFTAMGHALAWKRRFGVPFVVDLQDPWRNDFHLSLPKSERPKKFWFDHWQRSVLEAATMPAADGVISVSPAYIDTVRSRYPELRDRPTKQIPFGVDSMDFEFAAQMPELNTAFKKAPDTLDLVFAGVVPPSMSRALRATIGAVHRQNSSGGKTRLMFHLVGTQYVTTRWSHDGPATQMAVKMGAERSITENVKRKPFFEALRALIDADIVVVLGTEDKSYLASKLALALMTGRPILGVVPAGGALDEQLSKAGVESVVRYEDHSGPGDMETAVLTTLRALCAQLPAKPTYGSEEVRRQSADVRTSEIVEIFNAAVSRFSQPGRRGI